MSTSEYILQAALILVVIRQIRESKLDLLALLAPIGLCSWAGFTYLQEIPSGGNDLVLIGGCVAFGVALGLASGAATHLRGVGRDVYARAGVVAAGLWIFGMGFRLVFEWGADHGLGDDLTRFSIEHAITGASAWTAALVLMAFAQVITRTLTIRLRAMRLTYAPHVAAVPAAA